MDPLDDASGIWSVEGVLDGSGRLGRARLGNLPCILGRRHGAGLQLPLGSVSSEHAEFYEQGGRLYVRDLGSTNGTFVNRRRLGDGPQALQHGDVLHFGEAELRILAPMDELGGLTVAVDLKSENLPHRLVTGIRELTQLLRQGAVTPHFQPIVRLADGALVAHEVLGRGAYTGLPASPYELFRIAEAADKEVELSDLFRRRGIEEGERLPDQPPLYVNTHPSELKGDGLVAALEALRKAHPKAKVVLEIHEAAVLGREPMRRLRDQLRDLDMAVAYDDFGAGQARLVELIEVPPEVLKFDIALIRDIHKADKGKRHLVGSFVSLLREQGITCLAEGVEVQEEAEVCRELGFELAQGWYFGRPAPVESWVGAS